ncbi:hypothetical protein [Pseudoalteromonas sp. SG44-1]|uniref:hypothetical protein n=1 Tax=Pseudoalteromonas sp. SG44-1 TaxID=2760964 RepID=UPI001C727E3B|nr:hypothetical protein [Pseudoalteromonas sp. SG44-1]
MLKLNKLWWEHLAPKPLISRLREVEALLKHFIQSQPYGKEWFKVARNPEGIFRLQPGQVIPVIHITFMKNIPGFIAPLKMLKPDHRTVVRETKYLSGKELESDEKTIPPIIQVELVTDPLFLEAARRGLITIDEALIKQPSLVFSIPAHFLLTPKYFPKKSYVLYQHIFGNGGSYPNDGYFYVGLTTRSWQKRWAEHKRAIKSGSHLLFHRKFREETKSGKVTYLHHKVMGITDNLEELYEAEEFLIEGHWDDERRLNMIPGGKSGLLYLRENGLLQNSAIPMPDDRSVILSGWLKHHPRKGLPAPWVAEKWRDNEWAVAQICGRDGRLSAEQVQAIRKLGKEYPAEEICNRIGAKNVVQVKRVLKDKTYTRVE